MADDMKPSIVIRLSRWTAERAQRPWLPFALPAFPMADFVLPVMPNQLLLAGLSLLAPNRWPAFAAVFAIGTALGGMLVAMGLQSLGMDRSVFLTADEAGGPLSMALSQIAENGLWFLAGIALLPWTPRLTVVACALAGIAPIAIFITLLLARLVPCTGLALAGAFGPRFAMRSAYVERFVDKARKAIS